MRYKGRIILGILLVFILATGNLFVQAQETDAERAYRISSIKSRYKTPNSRTGTSGYKFYFKALKHIEKQEYPAAIEFLNKGVSLGNFDSRLTLARMYRTGKGIEQNQKKALEMYCSLSEDNFPVGTYMSGLCYENGWGAERDYQKAKEYYLKAIELSPYSSASYRALGSLYFRGMVGKKDYSKAYELYLKAAELKNPLAAYNVGLMQLKGMGVKEDSETAYTWFEKAAELGEPKAMHYLALRCEAQGEYLDAARLYRRAVQAGYPESGFNLAILLRSGRTGEKDFSGALEILKEIASKGHLNAAVQVGRMYEKGEGVPRDFALAGSWYQAAAEKNLPLAQYYLGVLYFEGKGTGQDTKKGMALIKKASEAGCPEALEFLSDYE